MVNSVLSLKIPNKHNAFGKRTRRVEITIFKRNIFYFFIVSRYFYSINYTLCIFINLRPAKSVSIFTMLWTGTCVESSSLTYVNYVLKCNLNVSVKLKFNVVLITNWFVESSLYAYGQEDKPLYTYMWHLQTTFRPVFRLLL